MASYFDTRTGKTYCGACDSASWSVLADCSVCGDPCCDDCASLEGESDLTCSRCAERVAEAAAEAAYWNDPGWRSVFGRPATVPALVGISPAAGPRFASIGNGLYVRTRRAS